MKVLVVGHTYFEPWNRRNILEMSKVKMRGEASNEITLVVPNEWRGPLRGTRKYTSGEFDKGFDIRPLPIINCGDCFEYKYLGLDKVVKEVKPDLIHIEQEPICASMYQTIKYRNKYVPKAPITSFMWENIDQKFTLRQRWRRRTAIRNISALIAGNTGALNLMRSKGYKGKVIVQAQLGVDKDIYYPMDSAALRAKTGLNGFVVGFLGRLTASKGIMTLLDAFAGLEFTSTLLIIGRGDLKDAIIERAKELNISDKFVLLDGLESHEVTPYINCFDVLVLPSITTPRWKEQFGHVLIEAMYCKVPVIGSDSGAIPEVIGDAGFVFPEKDHVKLRECIKSLNDNPSLVKKFVETAYEWASKKYLYSVVAGNVVALWDEVSR